MIEYTPEPVGDLTLDWVNRELNNIANVLGYKDLYLSIRTITSAAYTIKDKDSVIIADATSNAITITLPFAIKERFVSVKKVDNTNNVTIATGGAETIDGASTKVLTTQYESVTLICDGSNWWIR